MSNTNRTSTTSYKEVLRGFDASGRAIVERVACDCADCRVVSYWADAAPGTTRNPIDVSAAYDADRRGR